MSLRDGVSRIGAVLRRVIGAPDYERYLAFTRACRPSVEPMTRDEFYRACVAHRYDKPGARCC